ncbi:hypothetical protein Tco_0611267 [Tanacetum coccineum]
MDRDPNPSGSGIQEELDEFDAWMDSVGTDDDEVPTEEVSQDLWEEISEEIDEARLKKVVDDMLRQRCNSREEHQYHHGNSRQKKYTLSLHKFPAVPFPDDDMEERTSRWNMLAKQFQIRRQKEQRENPERLYLDSKIIEVIRCSYELGHEHKFITEVIARRANGKIDPITELDYKYLNKNNIRDLYLLCVNGKVDDYKETGLLGSLIVFIKSTIIWKRVHDFLLGMESYQQKVNLTAPTITFPVIEKEKLFSITSEPIIGMIYENNKKEKKVMIHKEIHTFCDATLKRVLNKLKKYNKDVKYGYANLSPSDANAEYLQFYKEDIEECLKHHDQMRR